LNAGDKYMRIDVGSPYNCLKILLRYALGSLIRPSLISIDNEFITFRNDKEEVVFEFPKLNYEYANKIAIEDIPSFGQEEYGRFFYEYGRVLFANLIVAITHLDWYAVGERSRNELRFVSEYYDELIKLNNKVSEVLSAFEDTIQLKRDPAMPYFDFMYAAFEITKIKQDNGLSSESSDVKNNRILALVYTALWFTIVGYILIFCQNTDIDGLSRILVASDNKSEASTLIKSISNSNEDENKIINICSLIFSYFSINRFYLISSGLTIQDPLLELLGKFSSHLMDLIENEEDLIIIDSDLIQGITETGPSLASFTDKYDPLADLGRFSCSGIIKADNTNIWSFGKEYVFMYKENNEDGAESIFNFIDPCVSKYIEKNAAINSYNNSDNIEIEKSFLYIKNIITGIENDKSGVVCPGTILQLTIIAATYRTIEKSSSFSRLQENKKLLVRVGIDMIDILIVLLYQLWFLSGKFFIQPTRPHYNNGSAVSTLELLREEVLAILEEYYEFVKYGKKTSEPLFKEIIKQRIIKRDVVSTQDIVNRFNPISDPTIYITESGKHGIYTIAYAALCNNINPSMTISQLAYWASKTPLDESILRAFSSFTEESDFAYTGIPMIDAMFKAYHAALKHIDDKPENFMIAVYALLYDIMEKLLIKNSGGNYFDFNNADNLTTSYKVESIVSEIIKKPLHVNIGNQSVQQKLTIEQEREALW
jgi:hypothetical protein